MSNPTIPSPTPTVSNAFQQVPSLTQIQQKVRRLTRSPSTAQLTDADLNNYINTFVVYDFPESLRTFNLRTEFSFYTNVGQDTYNTDIASFSGAVNNPLYNFQNLYLTVHPPFFIAGYQAFFSQSPEQFYGIYPRVNSIVLQRNGNGTMGPFTGIVNTQQSIIPPNFTQTIYLLQNNVLFSAIGSPAVNEQIGMSMVDIPLVDAGTGFKVNFGNLYDPNSAAYDNALRTPPTVLDPNNNINYLTGAYTVNFPYNTVSMTPINAQVVPQNVGIPQAVLLYSNVFVIRPVPDQAYKVNFEVYQRPTALLATGQAPELEEYWQYIAYGAALKVFQDRMDMDSAQMIMPEFRRQENMMLRRTLVQYANQRTATIYTEQVGFGGFNNGFGGFGSGSN